MCRTDGEAADVYTITNRIARKEHKCGECGRTIMAGEPYEYHSSVYDGSASNHSVCSHCSVLAEWLSKECGGTIIHELIEDIEEHAQDYARQDLKELALQARSHWSWPEGSRLNGYRGRPIPALPPGLTEQRQTESGK